MTRKPFLSSQPSALLLWRKGPAKRARSTGKHDVHVVHQRGTKEAMQHVHMKYSRKSRCGWQSQNCDKRWAKPTPNGAATITAGQHLRYQFQAPTDPPRLPHPRELLASKDCLLGTRFGRLQVVWWVRTILAASKSSCSSLGRSTAGDRRVIGTKARETRRQFVNSWLH